MSLLNCRMLSLTDFENNDNNNTDIIVITIINEDLAGLLSPAQ